MIGMQKKYDAGVYSTGEIAEICGVSVRTVQYYDKRGILTPAELSEGGRRMYTEEDVERLRLLTYLRSLGLSIGNIAAILKEENCDKVISSVMDERIRTLFDEIDERKTQLKEAKAFRSELNHAPEISPESMQFIADIVKTKDELRTMRRNMWIYAVIMGIVEYGSLIFAIITGMWLVFAAGMALVIASIPFFIKNYYEHVNYLCPECHKVFKANRKEFLFAKHTYTTRKLTCPHCAVKSFCVETAREPDETTAMKKQQRTGTRRKWPR